MAATVEQPASSRTSGPGRAISLILLGMFLLVAGVLIMAISLGLPIYLYAVAGGPGGLVAAGLIPPSWLLALALIAGGLAALKKGWAFRSGRRDA